MLVWGRLGIISQDTIQWPPLRDWFRWKAAQRHVTILSNGMWHNFIQRQLLSYRNPQGGCLRIEARAKHRLTEMWGGNGRNKQYHGNMRGFKFGTQTMEGWNPLSNGGFLFMNSTLSTKRISNRRRGNTAPMICPDRFGGTIGLVGLAGCRRIATEWTTVSCHNTLMVWYIVIGDIKYRLLIPDWEAKHQLGYVAGCQDDVNHNQGHVCSVLLRLFIATNTIL